MEFRWNNEKNNWLKETRGITFDEIVDTILKQGVINDIPHPNFEKCLTQRIMFVNVNGYIYKVPYVIDKENGYIFFKNNYS